MHRTVQDCPRPPVLDAGLRQTDVVFNAVADPLNALHDARIVFEVASHRSQLPQFGQVHHLVHQLHTSTKSPSAVNRKPSALGTVSWCSRLTYCLTRYHSAV